MRILDLGCGTGTNLAQLGATGTDEVTGVDIDDKVLAIARLVGAGEKLPFDNASFDRMISNVALPYMDIPKTLLEIHRVLVPGGQVWPSLHLASFTVREIRNTSSHLLSLVFRLYVLGNGVGFHCTGKTLWFVNGRTESFQTECGMRIALRRAGFINATFTRPEGPVGKRLIVQAIKTDWASNGHAHFVADAGLNPRFKFHCSTQPHISNCWLPAAI
jgi:ubiquinone/menaquinone biosynthesis C-methylase UbiE